MEWELRIILALFGVAIIGYVVFDGMRRARRRSDDTIHLPPIDDSESERRDSEGFDMDGVGSVRRRNLDESHVELEDEPLSMADTLIASRDDPSLNMESIRASSTERPAAKPATPAPAEKRTTTSAEPESVGGDPELIFSIGLLASADAPFPGKALLQALVENGCRFGDMDIFHRSASASQADQHYFSVANALKPGTFDLSTMEQQTFQGVTFFMTLPGSSVPDIAHQTMVECAKRLQQSLQGRLVDGTRSVYTEQTMQHEQEQIKEFQRRLLAKQS